VGGCEEGGCEEGGCEEGGSEEGGCDPLSFPLLQAANNVSAIARVRMTTTAFFILFTPFHFCALHFLRFEINVFARLQKI
jgi:hypothetical protein